MPPEHSEDVGRQLKQRREDLGLTQQDVADALDISTRTIQFAEHGRTKIRLGKREAYERVLRLQRGTISRAYRSGADLELIDIIGGPAAAEPEPWMEAEWAVYAIDWPDLAEIDRRRMVDTLRDSLDLPPRRDWTPPSAQGGHGESSTDARDGGSLT